MALGSLPVSKRTSDPTGLRSTIIGIIKSAANNAPRSLQKRIGPSQVGTECTRQLAYEMSGVTPTRGYSDPWPSIVGTATHAWLADAFEADNQQRVANGQEPRWHVEQRVDVGFGLNGSCDVFDAQTGTVLDHKILGNTTYSKYTKSGPSEVYRVQAHCYGLGYMRKGFDVKRVGINFFGRAKTLNDLYVWSEPFDINVALKALDRMNKIQAALDAGAAPRTLEPNPGGACVFCTYKGCVDEGYCEGTGED